MGTRRCRLEEVAVARSGDKGDSCNVGVVARRKELLPHLERELTEERVAEYFGALVKGKVTRYNSTGRTEKTGGLDILYSGGLFCFAVILPIGFIITRPSISNYVD